MEDEAAPPVELRHATLLPLVLVLGGLAALAFALYAGWNNPRPPWPPDQVWEGPMALTVEQPATHTVRLLGAIAGDFTLEAVARPQGPAAFDGYGLVYRAEGHERFNVFAVGADGYIGVLRIDRGAEVGRLQWQAFPHVHRGSATNRLRVACAGGVCRFWVNDEYVAALPDEDAGQGIGCWVRRFDAPRETVVYDWVGLWRAGR